MKIIQLTKGQIALVDDEDYEYLNQWKWCALKPKKSKTFYAVRRSRKLRKYIYMHREILKIIFDSKIKIDHEDRNGLNNQKDNLRTATHSQNMANIVAKKGSVSKYLGVCWSGKQKRWIAQITRKDNKGSKWLGSFVDEKDAALAYNNAAIEVHGKFASLNIL